MFESHPSWDLEKIRDLFRAAGEIALEYFDAPPTELKSDQTVVTLADKKIEKLFASVLDVPANDSYMIGEETVANCSPEYIAEALKSPECWVLDPIDGTAPYSSHMDYWGISLGLMRRGKLVDGAVYLPRFNCLIATCNEKLLQCDPDSNSPWQEFKAQSDPLALNGHISLGQLLTRSWGFDGKNTLFSLCSCVGSLYLLLSGKVTAYCGDFKLWDIAGMLPVIQRANFSIVSFAEGDPQLSGDLADDMFELHSSERMWRVKAPIIAAADNTTALELKQKFYRL